MTVERATSTIEYGNARVRGHRAKLLSQEDFQRLRQITSLEKLIVALSAGKYKTVLEESSLIRTGETIVGYALSEFLREEYHFVESLYAENLRGPLRIIAAAWDVADLKTVIRGKYSGASETDIIASFIGSGAVIKRDAMRVLAKQKSIEDVINTALTLRLPYADALRVGAEQFVIESAYTSFEAAIDKAYYAWVVKEVKKFRVQSSVIRSYAIENVDRRNIMTLLRLIRGGKGFDSAGQAEEYLLSGGEVVSSPQEFFELSNLDEIDNLVKKLKSTELTDLLAKSIPEMMVSGSLADFDGAASAHTLRKAIKIGRRDLHGIDVATAYLLALENEARNIRLIAHAVNFGIPGSYVERELTIV